MITTSQNAPQSQLLFAMKPEIALGKIVVSDENRIIQAINNSFPFVGSGIDWKNVPGSIQEESSVDDYFSFARSFLEKAADRIGLEETDVVVVVGDSAMGVALSLTIEDLRKYLDEILLMPQHTYIVSPDVRWCICFRMEGYVGFGPEPN